MTTSYAYRVSSPTPKVVEDAFRLPNYKNVNAALTVWYNNSEVDLSQFQYISDYTIVESKYNY